MITVFDIIHNGINHTSDISFEDVVYENINLESKDIKKNNEKMKVIKKKIKINGKTVNISLVFDKDNNLVIPTKIKKAGTRKNANLQK